MSTATIILAAGPSLRLKGEPKQLIQYQGQSLLRRTVNMALLRAGLAGLAAGESARLAPVIVVVGAYKDRVVPELTGLPITIVDNRAWESGVASSIRTGLAALHLMQPDAPAVFLLNVDQPAVSAGLLGYMQQVGQEEKKGLVACRYDGNLNLPALFTRPYFEELLQLKGDKSARWVLVRHRADCAAVPFEGGSLDIDAPWDLEKLIPANPSDVDGSLPDSDR
jgi:molybdenum cofactor cytidylyltransferase